MNFVIMGRSRYAVLLLLPYYLYATDVFFVYNSQRRRRGLRGAIPRSGIELRDAWRDVDTGAVVRFPRRWLIGVHLLNEPAVSGGVSKWSKGNRDAWIKFFGSF